MQNFLNFLPPLPSASKIKNWDELAAQFGLEEFVLMENAGRAAFNVLHQYRPHLKDENVLVLMGSGNNGGDAACIARNLMDYGAKCHIFSFKQKYDFNSTCSKHLDLALKNGASFYTIQKNNASAAGLRDLVLSITDDLPSIYIDGLLGTGFRGTVKDNMRELIEALNFITRYRTDSFVLSLDIPSGMDSSTGLPSPVCIRANATASFVASKPGEILPHAQKWIGTLHVCNIGMPQKIVAQSPPDMWLLDGHALECLPGAGSNTYKNCFGHVAVIGGKNGYTGAAHLASMAALATGSGLVSAIAAAGNAESIKGGIPEVMIYRTAGATPNAWPDHIDSDLDSFLKQMDALIIGPGFGRDNNSEIFLQELLKLNLKCPIVYDADALMIFARRHDLFKFISPLDIFTPHPGEAAALLGISPTEVQKDRIAALQSLCGLSKAVCVLKGANTLISQAGMPTFVCPYDICQLAVGGSGDVLSGCMGSLLGSRQYQNLPRIELACTGVVLHALAGLLCAKEYPFRGALASSIIKYLPFVREKFKSCPTSGNDGEILPWPNSNWQI